MTKADYSNLVGHFAEEALSLTNDEMEDISARFGKRILIWLDELEDRVDIVKFVDDVQERASEISGWEFK